MHTRPALIRTHGRQHGIQLGLTPLGARALLGLPAATLAGEITHHPNIASPLTASLHERLAGLGWRERFALLETTLLHRVHRGARGAAVPGAVAEAWHLVRASRGRMSVDELADRTGWSRRHLTTLFTREFGIGPKMALRLARFEQARALGGRGVALADVAARCGYVDQAHLTRDWRSFAGLSPRTTLAEFPDVQDEVPSSG